MIEAAAENNLFVDDHDDISLLENKCDKSETIEKAATNYFNDNEQISQAKYDKDGKMIESIDCFDNDNNTFQIINPPIISQSQSQEIRTSQLFFLGWKMQILMIIFAILVSFYLMLPSSFLSLIYSLTAAYILGFATGLVLSISIFYILHKFNLLRYIISIPSFNKIEEQNQQQHIDKFERNEKLRNLLIQTAFDKTSDPNSSSNSNNFDGVYKGWMNELREVYDPENYFLNKT